MRSFRVRARLFPVDRRGLEQAVELVVSTRTIMSVIPRNVAEAAGVEILARRFFFGRDGTRKRRAVGSLEIAVEGRSAVSTVILGVPGDTPTLGTSTLDDLGLEADYEAGRLRERSPLSVYGKAKAPKRTPAPS